MTNTGLAHLLQLQELQRLDVRGCKGVTKEGIEKFPKSVRIDRKPTQDK